MYRQRKIWFGALAMFVVMGVAVLIYTHMRHTEAVPRAGEALPYAEVVSASGTHVVHAGQTLPTGDTARTVRLYYRTTSSGPVTFRMCGYPQPSYLGKHIISEYDDDVQHFASAQTYRVKGVDQDTPVNAARPANTVCKYYSRVSSGRSGVAVDVSDLCKLQSSYVIFKGKAGDMPGSVSMCTLTGTVTSLMVQD